MSLYKKKKEETWSNLLVRRSLGLPEVGSVMSHQIALQK